MKIRNGCVALGILSLVLSLAAQTSSSTASTTQLPRLVKFSGTLKDANGNALTGVVGVTFALYSEPSGGAPLWLETQNVQPDKNGHYTVLLGSTKPEGLPLDLFVSEQARWLGAQVQGLTEPQAESARVLLVAVPYAMKAADAETVGGLPPSAFVMALPVSSGAGGANGATSSSASPAPGGTSNVTTTGGSVNTLPLWTTATNIQSSTITQTGSGSTAKIGIGTTTPAVTLDVKGAENVGGTLTLPAMGTAISTKGYNSQPDLMIASVFNSGSATAVAQKFQLQAEPVNNDKTTASGTLNLLYGSGTAAPAETGLKINNKGQITFATGQTFPGAGTITGVTAGTDLTGGGSSGKVTLNLDTTKVPQLTAANTFTGNQTINGDLTENGAINASGSISSTNGTISALSGGFSANGNFDGVDAFASVAGYNGVLGFSTATSGTSTGVFGITESDTGYGVYGINGASSENGAGVYGVDYVASSTGSTLRHSAGVWGDGGGSGGYIYGVLATADFSWALTAINNSGTATIGGNPTGYFMNEGYDAGDSSPALYAGNGNPTSVNDQNCTIYNTGDLYCTGSKSAVVPVDNGARKVALYAIEGPENWFEDAGSGHLVNGAATITLEPIFAQTINTNLDYHVFLTPNADCKGLYVARKSAVSFEVHELGGGTSTLDFDYRIMAKRKGYENVRLADMTKQSKSPNLVRRRGKESSTAPAKSGQSPAKRVAAPIQPAVQPVAK